MHYEIERKFLVRNDCWRAFADRPFAIQQGYIARGKSVSVRVRIIDGKSAMLTLKTAVVGIRRLEFEYPLPLADGAVLLSNRNGALIEKHRYRLPCDDLMWEIDVFQGDNEGLVIAEIELPHENKVFTKPDWLGQEVTLERRYSNANLAKLPFKQWPASMIDENTANDFGRKSYRDLSVFCRG